MAYETLNLPDREELVDLIVGLIPSIEDEFRAPGCEDEDEASMQLTIGWNAETGSWSYQTGDNSFSGGAYGYPHWSVVTLGREIDAQSTADEILDELDELAMDDVE